MSETNEKPEVVNKDNTDESAAIDYLDDNEEEVTEEQNPSTTDVTNSSSTATSLLDLLNSNQNDIENFSEEFNTKAEEFEGLISSTPGISGNMDEKSVYVGDVDYSATNEELKEYFKQCGEIKRATIQTNRIGKPKGFAYVEFEDVEGAKKALTLSNTEFKGRQLKVRMKRVNVPHFQRGGGRGGYRGGYRGRGGYYRGRGGYYRGRGGY